MTKKKAWVLGIVLLVVGGFAAAIAWIPRVEFILGGAMVNVGYRLQDRLHEFDFVHDDSITPEQIWEELLQHNDLAASVRDYFPRTAYHPVVAVLACMDGRLDIDELMGDTRRYYYVVRTAGSVLGKAEQEMLELAVLNGVRVILLTTHTDCAAEKAAATPESRERFPALISLVDEHERTIEEFLARPIIRDAIDAGRLAIKYARIDTNTDRLYLQTH